MAAANKAAFEDLLGPLNEARLASVGKDDSLSRWGSTFTAIQVSLEWAVTLNTKPSTVDYSRVQSNLEHRHDLCCHKVVPVTETFQVMEGFRSVKMLRS